MGSALSWGALRSFLAHVKPGSALGAELNPDATEWSTVMKTNAILADIYDQLTLVNANLRVLITHKPGRKPDPYKRPGMRNKKHFGKDTLPVSELREWIKSRQRKEVVLNGND